MPDYRPLVVESNGDIKRLKNVDTLVNGSNAPYLIADDLQYYLTLTRNAITFNVTIGAGYTFSRYNILIQDSYEIIVEDEGELVAL